MIPMSRPLSMTILMANIKPQDGLWLIAGTVSYVIMALWTALAAMLSQVPAIGDALGVNGLGPFFLVPVLIGMAWGLVFHRAKLQVRPTVVFIPLAVLLYEVILTYKYELFSGQVAKIIFDSFFGPNCESSECLYELMETGPAILVISVYAVNRLCGLKGDART